MAINVVALGVHSGLPEESKPAREGLGLPLLSLLLLPLELGLPLLAPSLLLLPLIVLLTSPSLTWPCTIKRTFKFQNISSF